MARTHAVEVLATVLVLIGVASSEKPSSGQGAAQPPSSAQASAPSEKPLQGASPTTPRRPQLDQVLRSMDDNAAKFHAVEADFSWTPHNGVVDIDEAPDKGKIYFQRVGRETQMAADIGPPREKQIVFKGGKIQVYQAGTGVLDVYDTSSHKDEVETFLVLGFGSSGQDLRKNFDVKYLGQEAVGGVQTDKLELVPLSKDIANRFPKIDLWIDPQRGLSLRQKLFQEGGDYRLADYSNIKLRDKIPESVFKIKTSGATKTITH